MGSIPATHCRQSSTVAWRKGAGETLRLAPIEQDKRYVAALLNSGENIPGVRIRVEDRLIQTRKERFEQKTAKEQAGGLPPGRLIEWSFQQRRDRPRIP